MKPKSKCKKSQMKGQDQSFNKLEEAICQTPPIPPMDLAHLNPAYIFESSPLDKILKYYVNGTEPIKTLISKECSIMFECKICKNIYRHLEELIQHKEKFCLESYNNLCNNFEIRTLVEDKLFSNSEEPSANMALVKHPQQTLRKPFTKKLSQIVDMLTLKKSEENNEPAKKAQVDHLQENNQTLTNLENSFENKNCSPESDTNEDVKSVLKFDLNSLHVKHLKNMKPITTSENPKKIQIQIRKDYLKNPENAYIYKSEESLRDIETNSINEHLNKNVNELKQSNKSNKEGCSAIQNEILPSTSTALATKPPTHSSSIASSNLQCLTCNRKCKNTNALRKHLTSHRSGYRYRCIDCSFKTYTRLDCLNHARKVHIKSDKKQRASDFIQLIETNSEVNYTIRDINQNDSKSEYIDNNVKFVSKPIVEVMESDTSTHNVTENDISKIEEDLRKSLVIDTNEKSNDRNISPENSNYFDPKLNPIEIKGSKKNSPKDVSNYSIVEETINSSIVLTPPLESQNDKTVNEPPAIAASTSNNINTSYLSLLNKDNYFYLANSKRKNYQSLTVKSLKNTLRSKIKKSIIKKNSVKSKKSLNDFVFIERVSRLSSLRSNKKIVEPPVNFNNNKKLIFNTNQVISSNNKLKSKLPRKTSLKSHNKLKCLKKHDLSSISIESNEFKLPPQNNLEENFNFSPSDEDFDMYAEELISHITLFQKMPEYKTEARNFENRNQHIETSHKDLFSKNKSKENSFSPENITNKKIKKSKTNNKANKTKKIQPDVKEQKEELKKSDHYTPKWQDITNSNKKKKKRITPNDSNKTKKKSKNKILTKTKIYSNDNLSLQFFTPSSHLNNIFTVNKTFDLKTSINQNAKTKKSPSKTKVKLNKKNKSHNNETELRVEGVKNENKIDLSTLPTDTTVELTLPLVESIKTEKVSFDLNDLPNNLIINLPSENSPIKNETLSELEESKVNSTIEIKQEVKDESEMNDSLIRPVRKRVKIHLPDFYYESDMPKSKRFSLSPTSKDHKKTKCKIKK